MQTLLLNVLPCVRLLDICPAGTTFRAACRWRLSLRREELVFQRRADDVGDSGGIEEGA